MKQNILWSNEIDYCDKIYEQVKEEMPNESDEVISMNVDSFLRFTHEDIIADLKGKFASEEIIAIANLGLWNRRTFGYKEVGYSLEDIFYSDDEYATWYIDGEDLCYTGVHHDGTNYITFRTAKEDLSDEEYDYFLGEIYNNEVDQELIDKYTNPIGDLLMEALNKN